MNRKRGFTLVELLVVMAIIAILASIVVPNVARYIERARMTKALSEIDSIELAMTAMLADAGRSNLSQLFQPGKVVLFSTTAEAFNTAVDMYTKAVYSLLRHGRSIRREDSDNADLIRQNLIPKLGQSYLELDVDPWGTAYRFWPGPWTGRRDTNPIPFRRFSADTEDEIVRVKEDAYVITTSDLTDEDPLASYFYDFEEMPAKIGFPADRSKVAYIWSFGGNIENSQMVYAPASTDPWVAYGSEDGDYWGGGDDVNNWDNTRSWERFYN